jgi:hypothetical protein
MMRWNQAKLIEVTGKKTKPAQKRWFNNVLGAVVPEDAIGVVMTDTVYEALMQRKCGLSIEINGKFIEYIPEPELRL